jgi:hypothetical protein
MKEDKEVKHYFKTVPSAEQAFTTSDGNVFTAKHYAEGYAQELKDKKVTTHDRKDYDLSDEVEKPVMTATASNEKDVVTATASTPVETANAGSSEPLDLKIAEVNATASNSTEAGNATVSNATEAGNETASTANEQSAAPKKSAKAKTK